MATGLRRVLLSMSMLLLLLVLLLLALLFMALVGESRCTVHLLLCLFYLSLNLPLFCSASFVLHFVGVVYQVGRVSY